MVAVGVLINTQLHGSQGSETGVMGNHDRTQPKTSSQVPEARKTVKREAEISLPLKTTSIGLG